MRQSPLLSENRERKPVSPKIEMKSQITILYTNDLHSSLQAFPKIATISRRVQAEGTNVLLCDVGDTLYEIREPTAETPLTEIVLEIMERVGYDVWVVGNRDIAPARAVDVLAKMRRRISFPILSANIADKTHPAFAQPYIIKRINAVNIGMLGLVGVGSEALPMAISPVEAAELYVPKLRAQCDVLLLLAHLGSKACAKIAEAVDGIDFIIGAHSHEKLSKPVMLGDVPYVQSGGFGKFIGRVDLMVGNEGIASYEAVLLPLDDKIPDDIDIKMLCERVLSDEKVRAAKLA